MICIVNSIRSSASRFSETPEELKQAVVIAEARNLITHNRGVVNEPYVRKTVAHVQFIPLYPAERL